MKKSLIVSSDNDGSRLDQVLCEQDDIPSRSYAAKLIDSGSVEIPKHQKKLKASTKLKEGWEVYYVLPEKKSSELTNWDKKLNIYFEDDDLIVLEKESGIVVHPSAGHEDKTLVNALLNHSEAFSMGLNEERPGIVHRLDKETSGLLVVAKNPETHLALTDLFKERNITRYYWAVCVGRPKNDEDSIESEIGRHPVDRKRMSSSSSQGKFAKTDYKVLGTKGQLSLIRFKLHTGRTHQIRVHSSEHQFPILCDETYNSFARLKSVFGPRKISELKKLGRFFLHAAVLGFKHPRTGEELLFYSPIPKELQTWMEDFAFVEYIKEEAFHA